MRRALLLVVVALALAGCSAPAHYPVGGPADPAEDTKGWERGIWYNETLSVTPEDGFNESERRMVIARSMARVEQLRDVEFEDRVRVEVRSRSAYRERILGNGSESDGTSDAALLDNAVYEALFLVGERVDSGEQQRETQASQVLGFYSPSRDEIVVISESETPVISETTLGHELVHAYQFRHFDPRYNTSTLESRNRDLGLIEGDASLLDYRYENRCADEWRCVERSAGAGGGSGDSAGSANVHQGISVLNYFPYSDGPIFVRTLQERGGWDAVNAAYDDPPASAEQVAIPEAYNTDPPVNVTVTDRNSSAWRRVTPRGPNYGSFGMPSMTTMFAYPSYDTSRRESGVIDPRSFLTSGPDSGLDPIDYVVPYSDGWEGDRMAAYEREDGELGYVWRSAWENGSEAREFADGYRELLRYWGGEEVRGTVWRIPEGESEFADAFAVRVEDDTVTITNAPSAGALTRVNARAEG